MNDLNKRIFVAGHRGMVGAAITRLLRARGHTELVTRTHDELDLADQAQVRAFFDEDRPQQIDLAAAKVGGIHANNVFPAEFVHANLMIEAYVVHQAWRTSAELISLGSSCIYPKFAPQPELVKKVVGYEGGIVLDRSKPDGTPRKLLDVSRLQALGWQLRVALEEGVRRAYTGFLQHHATAAA